MDFSDWFDFKNRVKQDTTLTKEVNGQTVTKQVKGSFNWLAFIFTFFYALFTQKYKTKDFLKKAAVPFVVLILINIIVGSITDPDIGFIVNIGGAVWYGFMFDTWFKNQLIANGYSVDNSVHSEQSSEHQDFE